MIKGTSINGSNPHDTLADMIASQKYQALPNGPESPARQNELDPIMSAYRERARLQLLREDIDLAIAAQPHERERLTNQLPVMNPKSTGVHLILRVPSEHSQYLSEGVPL